MRMHASTSQIVGRATTLLLLTGAALPAEAAYTRISGQECISSTQVLVTDGSNDGLGTTHRGETQRRVQTSGNDTLAHVEHSLGSGPELAAVMCPVPDTEAQPVTAFSGVNIHVRDSSSTRPVRAWIVSQNFDNGGQSARFLGRTGSSSNVCSGGSNCQISGTFSLPDDGSFRHVLVMLPKGTASDGQGSELYGLYVY